MADDVVVDSGEVVTGERTPRERSERQMSDTPAVTVETGNIHDGPTPEEALRDAQKALEQRDKDTAAAASRASAAENEAARARDQLARERMGRQNDRAAAVVSAAEAAKSDKVAAISALKTARDSGDFDAEMRALEMLNSADFRLNQTAGEIAQMKMMEESGHHEAPPAGNGGQPAARITPAAQSWMDRNPRFNSDGAFRKAALEAHYNAIKDGVNADSPAYFRMLDQAVTDFVSRETGGGNGDMGNRGNQRPSSSEGAPVGRGSGGHGGASRTVQTKLGTLNVTRRADGKLGIVIPPGVRADFEEGAKVTGMSLGEYALEQVKIADEIAAGGNAGLITEEGSIYR